MIGERADFCHECKKAGQGRYGFPACDQTYHGGCADPTPRPSPRMRIAWEVYKDLRHQWATETDGWGDSRRTGLPLERVKVYCDAHGLALRPWLLEALGKLVDRRLDVDREARQKRYDNWKAEQE